jgi:kinetochore protein Nuf2
MHLIPCHRSRFASAAQVADFSAKDLYAPEKGRTLTLLSAFINFVKFTEQFCDKFVKDLREHSEKILGEREEVAEELENIQREIEAIKYVLLIENYFTYISITRAKMAEDEPQCAALRKENEVLRAKMFEIKNSQAQAVSELESLKAEKDTLVRQRVNRPRVNP